MNYQLIFKIKVSILIIFLFNGNTSKSQGLFKGGNYLKIDFNDNGLHQIINDTIYCKINEIKNNLVFEIQDYSLISYKSSSNYILYSYQTNNIYITDKKKEEIVEGGSVIGSTKDILFYKVPVRKRKKVFHYYFSLKGKKRKKIKIYTKVFTLEELSSIHKYQGSLNYKNSNIEGYYYLLSRIPSLVLKAEGNNSIDTLVGGKNKIMPSGIMMSRHNGEIWYKEKIDLIDLNGEIHKNIQLDFTNFFLLEKKISTYFEISDISIKGKDLKMIVNKVSCKGETIKSVETKIVTIYLRINTVKSVIPVKISSRVILNDVE